MRLDELPLRAPPASVKMPAEAEHNRLEKTMRNVIFTLFTAAALGAVMTGAAQAQSRGYYEVVGVEADDMLKMRAGPGVNYKIVLGLPNGTELWVHDCERSGNTSWCKVSLREARGLKGYVSSAYLRER